MSAAPEATSNAPADADAARHYEGVVYQVYPRSFRDADGDGVGDLAGVRAGLEHLEWLGVDAVWLSPIYRSPMVDAGYDVSDHCDVDPVFGTLADADALIAEAHGRGLGVWLDWVPNHTSIEHPWFVAARSSRDDPHRDWFVWRDPAPDGGPPNNWRQHFASGRASAWTLDAASGQYYLHHFLPEQPDVNWEHEALAEAQCDVLRFWMDRGVDGFRADAVHFIGQDRTYPDDPEQLLTDGRGWFHHHPSTADHLRRVRRTLDERGAWMVGEITLDDPAAQLAHVGADRLHHAHVFGLADAPWDAAAWSSVIDRVDGAYAAAGESPAWMLGNHDRSRVATRLGSRERARVAATLLLGLRGVPFLYAGEELGLEDAMVPADRIVDPGGRDGCRAPLPWYEDASGGWVDDAWLPPPPEAAARSVAAQRRDPRSVLHLHRRLVTARRWSAALRSGTQEVLDLGEGIVALRRVAPPGPSRPGADTGDRLVLANLTDEPLAVHPGGDWRVTVASDLVGDGDVLPGHLGAQRAVVLAPA